MVRLSLGEWLLRPLRGKVRNLIYKVEPRIEFDGGITVPPGQISKNTLSFLTELKDPDHNDREWFKLHG